MRRCRWRGRAPATNRKPGPSKRCSTASLPRRQSRRGWPSLPVRSACRRLPWPSSAVEQRDWLAENQAGLTGITVGRFRILPEHRCNEATPPHLLRLLVDAGPAFGSGRHETTQGCLRLLDEIARERRPRRILDLGAGSGILALAAAQMWKRPVVAADIDPVAVRTMRLNAKRNRSTPLIDARCGNGLDPVRRERPFDLVMANILAGPLAELAPGMSRRRRATRGRLILSGILTHPGKPGSLPLSGRRLQA